MHLTDLEQALAPCQVSVGVTDTGRHTVVTVTAPAGHRFQNGRTDYVLGWRRRSREREEDLLSLVEAVHQEWGALEDCR